MWNLFIIDIAIIFLLKCWHFRYCVTRDWIIFKSCFVWLYLTLLWQKAVERGCTASSLQGGVEVQVPHAALWHLKGEGSSLLMWGLYLLLTRLLHGDKSLAVRYVSLLFPVWPPLTLWGMGVYLHLVGMKVPAPVRDEGWYRCYPSRAVGSPCCNSLLGLCWLGGEHCFSVFCGVWLQ